MWESEYQRILLEARRRYGQELGRRMLEQLNREYALMIARIFDEVSRGQFPTSQSAARARNLVIDIRRIMDEYQVRMEAMYREGAERTVKAVEAAHNQALALAADAVDVRVTATISLAPQRVIETMMVRRELGLSENFKTLLNRNMRSAALDVDRFIASAIGRGVDSNRAAQELATILARDDDDVLRALSNLGPRGGRTRKAIKDAVDIPDDVLRRARSALYDSRRIMVSEIQNTFFESDRQAAVQSPMIDLVQWTLSGRHAGLPTSPDICDYYATADLHGYGPGLFHPASVPPPPHPNDQCQMTPVLRPPRDWDKPNRPLPNPRKVSIEQFRREMQKLARGTRLEGRMSTKHRYVDGQYRMLRGVQSAHRVAVGTNNVR